MLEVGSVIAGKLRIERILGEGGMGIVAAATHLQLDQRVAVKVMRDQVAHDPSTVERFMREARAAARLRSENVCRVTDVGQLPSGAPYIVMELLEGTDLAVLVKRTPLSIATAADYVLQACIAIGEAHANGIVHRDLKPANLFLTKHLGGAPLIKVLDFGIAKAATKAEPALTQTESMMGSPGYMSPEQLRSSRDVDARTDVWALGVILYQLVSARLPFPADSVTELAVKVAMDPPDPLDVDAAFRDVVMRCLEKRPADRYANVLALATALAPFGTDSARRSLAVIEQLAPKPDPAAFASTLAPEAASTAPLVEPTARTAVTFSSGPNPVTTLGGATGDAQVAAPPTTASRNRTPLWLAVGAVAIAGGVVGVVALMREPPVPRGSTLPVSAVTQPPSTPQPVAADPAKVTELGARFDKAIEAARCVEATTVRDELLALGAGATANEQVAKCLEHRMTAFQDPSTTRNAHAMLAMAEELYEAAQYGQARAIVDRVLIANQDSQPSRSLGARIACKEGAPAFARTYVTGMPAGKLRDEAVAVCKTHDVDLAEPVAKVAATTTGKQRPSPRPAPASPAESSADWKMDAGHAMMTANYKQARAIALKALAAAPGDQHAMYIITGSYCYEEDAPNALKWGAKLEDKQRAKAQRFACDRADITLDAK